MKTTLIAFFFIIAANTFAQSTTSITVTIDNVTSNEGSVLYGLYTQDTFMKAPPVKSQKSSIKEGKTSVVFEEVAPGTYAVICFHDTNGNGQMDFETNGMPKESYGSSNNIIFMGPPQWEDCKFEVESEPITLQIRF